MKQLLTQSHRGFKAKSFVIFVICVVLIFYNQGYGNDAFNTSQTIANTAVIEFFSSDNAIITRIHVKIADTPIKRAKGLMHVTKLAEDEGMLFVYQSSDIRTFWMKNTPLPLDIIFIDEKYKILNFAESTKPMSENSYESSGPAKYVIEVNAGFVKKFNINVGDYVFISKPIKMEDLDLKDWIKLGCLVNDRLEGGSDENQR